jgi:hypothetical protein
MAHGLPRQAGVSVFRMQEGDLLPRQQELTDVQSYQHVAHVISLVRRVTRSAGDQMLDQVGVLEASGGWTAGQQRRPASTRKLHSR